MRDYVESIKVDDYVVKITGSISSVIKNVELLCTSSLLEIHFLKKKFPGVRKYSNFFYGKSKVTVDCWKKRIFVSINL